MTLCTEGVSPADGDGRFLPDVGGSFLQAQTIKYYKVGTSENISYSMLKISSTYLRSLERRGTLCCPPSLPLLLSHLLKVPMGK